MSIRVAINGFGRIGRMVFRRAMEVDDIQIVAVNGTANVETCVHLLKYDSIHGTWRVPMIAHEDGFEVAGHDVRYLSTRDLEMLPWDELDVDVVVEATGKFCTRETLSTHLRQGAKRVILTAPAKTATDVDLTMVQGVNDDAYHPHVHRIVSAASCTTNCLAPIVKVLHESFGLEHGMVTTVHAFTNDQNSLDNPHQDLRRARACGESLIPTSTGAAKAIGLVLPELAGRLNGVSIRVPTPNVSLIDLVAKLSRPVSAQAVNLRLAEAARNQFYGLIDYTEEPLVSVDFYGDSHSAVVDGLSTMVIADETVKVLAWYDNEWGYSCRVVDLAKRIGGAGEVDHVGPQGVGRAEISMV